MKVKKSSFIFMYLHISSYFFTLKVKKYFFTLKVKKYEDKYEEIFISQYVFAAAQLKPCAAGSSISSNSSSSTRSSSSCSSQAMAPKAANQYFEPEDLAKRWRPLVASAAWSWLGTGYSKPSRSQGPDRPGLATYSTPLLALLEVAPNGLPALTCLRDTLLLLDGESGVLRAGKGHPQTVAAGAADRLSKLLYCRCSCDRVQLRGGSRGGEPSQLHP